MNKQAKWDIRFLRLAKHISSWSRDQSTKVASVIVRPDFTICSTGVNGFPRGSDDNPKLFKNRDIKLKRILHSEINSLLFSREPVNGYTLYIYPFESCSQCAAAIVQSGIKRIVSIPTPKDLFERWKDSIIQGRELLKLGKVKVDLIKQELLENEI